MKDNDDYTFVMRYGTHSKSVCKWIMEFEATKHMTLYRDKFATYEVVATYNVQLDDNSFVEAIIMRFIIVIAI